MENKFNFGDKVKHIVHGTSGIVMAYSHYSTGCIHYGIQPQDLDEDGEPRDWKWYDETKLKLVRAGAVEVISYLDKEKTKPAKNGGPAPNAPQGR